MREFSQWNANSTLAQTLSIRGQRDATRPDADRVQHRSPVSILSRAPAEVLNERDAARAAELTPNMAVLGDPLPGRSALDTKLRTRSIPIA
jgi:hypothetical protein